MFEEFGVKVKWKAIFFELFVVVWGVHWSDNMFSAGSSLEVYGCGGRSESVCDVVGYCDAWEVLEFNS